MKKKIYVGTEVLRTKPAIAHLEKNINSLERKINRVALSSGLAAPLITLYSERLEVQRSLLTWLQNVSR